MEYVVDIEKYDHQGRGIGYTDGIITFIPNALINEKVKIRITKNTKKVREAEVIGIIEKSSDRLDPNCKYFNLCGGCNMMHISYEQELEYKENKVKEIINRYTDIDIEKVKKIIPNKELNYRNKATFQVKGKVGYYKEKSYDIIPIDNCLIVDNKINDILNILKQMDLSNIYQIVVRSSKNLDETMVVFKGTNIDTSILKDKVSTIILYNKEYKLMSGNGYIVDKIGEYSFIISPESFFQVNTNNAYNLYNKVFEYVKESDNLLDLYCGTGTIGIFLSKICKKVTGVEINKYAIEDALKNKELNKIKNINFVCSDTANYYELDNFDTVVVDPPRSGLDNKTIDYLFNLKSKKIVYVSCDPVTLARDLKLLSELYDAIEIKPVDMFSRTYHVECVVKLCRKNIEK